MQSFVWWRVDPAGLNNHTTVKVKNPNGKLVVFTDDICLKLTSRPTEFLLQTQFIVNPKPFLVDLTGQLVKVKLKWGTEYIGKLESADAYMNMLLTNTEEYIDGQCAGELGEVLIRCNNVLYVVAAPKKKNNNNNKTEDAVMADL